MKSELGSVNESTNLTLIPINESLYFRAKSFHKTHQLYKVFAEKIFSFPLLPSLYFIFIRSRVIKSGIHIIYKYISGNFSIFPKRIIIERCLYRV